MATYSIAPFIGAFYQGLTNSGLIAPNAAGSIQAYLAGTTTPTPTYTDATGATPNANPVVLSASGQPPGEIWLDNTIAYKFVVSDASANVLATYDNVYPTGSVLGLNGNGANTTGPFAALLAAAGYQKLPSGLIIQWGTAPGVAAGGSQLVNLPIAFPTGGFAGVASITLGSNATVDAKLGVGLTSASAITIYNTGAAGPVTPFWVVIGR